MIGCVKRVADLAGLFETRQMRAYDEDFVLLRYPDCQKETVCFEYSYYEGAQYEKITVNCRTGDIHSGYTGFKQFGAAVRALAMLFESYSNSYFCCDNHFGSKEMRWLSYALEMPITLPCHATIWDDYEDYMQHIDDDSKISSMDFFNSYEGNSANCDEINLIFYVNDVINTDFVNNCVNNKESVDKSSYGYWIRSMARFLWLAKKDSAKTENELLSHYMKILRNISKIREEIISGVNVSPVKELFAVLAPPVTIKLIATIHNIDFWPLWRENKYKIGVTSSIFYHNQATENAENQDVTLAPITTEEYFDVAPEDRLYWWRENGDVIISDKTQRWLEDMAEQHKVHCETMDEDFSAVDWHQRLVLLLGSHNGTIKMFETLYCDFLNSFHKKAYRAWIEMLEVLAESDISECRRLIAVLTNASLRIKIFGV